MIAMQHKQPTNTLDIQFDLYHIPASVLYKLYLHPLCQTNAV